jgi:hypothetical protein
MNGYHLPKQIFINKNVITQELNKQITINGKSFFRIEYDISKLDNKLIYDKGMYKTIYKYLSKCSNAPYGLFLKITGKDLILSEKVFIFLLWSSK